MLIINMKPIVNQLNEVIISNGVISVSMGIIPKDKKYLHPRKEN